MRLNEVEDEVRRYAGEEKVPRVERLSVDGRQFDGGVGRRTVAFQIGFFERSFQRIQNAGRKVF